MDKNEILAELEWCMKELDGPRALQFLRTYHTEIKAMAWDVARLDWVATHSHGMRSKAKGTVNAFVWRANYPIRGAGENSNLRASIDVAMIAHSAEVSDAT